VNNIHPFLSSFPVALIITAFVLEVFSLFTASEKWRTVIFTNLIFAAIFTLLAFVSGYQAKEIANQTFQVSEDLILFHHYWGRALLFCVIPCVAFHFFMQRSPQAMIRYLYLLSLALITAIALYAGYLGGELVFSHGAGVKARIMNEQ
jgi:uncharacterized membrane protein